MGQSFDARCTECETEFEVSEGGGFHFALLHCKLCGAPRSVPLEIQPDGEPKLGPFDRHCDCGGTFTQSAKPRCPKCRSTDYEPIGNYLNYD